MVLLVEQPAEPLAAGDMRYSDTTVLRLIAFTKFVKAALLILAGIGILKLLHMNPAIELNHWIAWLGFDPGQRFVGQAIQKITNIPTHRIREMGIATFPYAGLFLTEGVGLWMLKRWAEWFTVVATGSLVPIEAVEIYRHPSAVKFLVLIANVGIVGYLVYRIKRHPAHA